MATVNYSIPDDVKTLFNAVFSGRNRSSVITELMRQAAEHELSLRRRREAVDAVLEARANVPPVSSQAIEEALREIRR